MVYNSASLVNKKKIKGSLDIDHVTRADHLKVIIEHKVIGNKHWGI